MAQKKKKSQGPSSKRVKKSNKEDDVKITGLISMHSRGFGFVQPDKPSPYTQDIFIPKSFTQSAMDGDLVEVLVSSVVSQKGPEGKILSILKRNRSEIAGVIESVSGKNKAFAYVPLLGDERKVVVTTDTSLAIGDRVTLEMVEWGEGTEPHVCKLKNKLGNINDPAVDIPATIKEFNLREEFPEEVKEEARQFSRDFSKKDLEGRVDYRGIPSYTIDPDTAKDYDDAISVKKTRGGYQLIVHIADVSHYVAPGTKLDDEAYKRCNSTYLPGKCLPMLPEELSNELCSLKPDVDRLTVSALMEFDKEGNLKSYSLDRSIIRSSFRFTYKQALQVIEGKMESPYKKDLLLMVELCKLLKKGRKSRGSVEFAVPELAIMVDNEGYPLGFEKIEYDITHQMIEEFMLKANELVAEHLTKAKKGLTYRVHDIPDKENVEQFVRMAASFGFKISSDPTPEELQNLFEEASSSPFGPFLVTSYIRSMKLAIYSADNIGHFGLALSHYCHFTSPIRRYVDLIVHRILLGTEKDSQKLDDVAKRASDCERVSAKAENQVKLIKKLRLLKRSDDEDPYKDYEGVIVRVKPFGIIVEVLGYEIEGFISLSAIEHDYFNFDENRQRLVGSKSGHILTVGDRVPLMLQEIDLIRLESKWILDEKKLFKKKTAKKDEKKRV